MSNQIIYSIQLEPSSNLETAINEQLSKYDQSVTGVIGADVGFYLQYAVSPPSYCIYSGNLFFTYDEESTENKSCKVKIWELESSAELETEIGQFMESEDFNGCAAISLSAKMIDNDKWFVMLVYLTESGDRELDYAAYIYEDTDAQAVDDAIINHLGDTDTPLLYSFIPADSSSGLNRGLVIYSK